MTPNRTVAYHLRRLRKARGWTQADLAERLNRRGIDWSVPSLGMAERSRNPRHRAHRFDADQIVTFAEVFGVHYTDFFAPPGSESPSACGGKVGATMTVTDWLAL